MNVLIIRWYRFHLFGISFHVHGKRAPNEVSRSIDYSGRG